MATPPPLSADWSVSDDPRQVGIVRRQAAVQVTEWGLPDLVDTVQLLLTELLTNAFEHTNGGGAEVHLSRIEGILEIEVSDLGAGRAQLKKPDEQRESGRGLLIVDALALAWGTRPRAGGRGKATWCTLKAEPQSFGLSAQTDTADVARRPQGSVVQSCVDPSLPRGLRRYVQYFCSPLVGPRCRFAFLGASYPFHDATGRAVLAA